MEKAKTNELDEELVVNVVKSIYSQLLLKYIGIGSSTMKGTLFMNSYKISLNI